MSESLLHDYINKNMDKCLCKIRLISSLSFVVLEDFKGAKGNIVSDFFEIKESVFRKYQHLLRSKTIFIVKRKKFLIFQLKIKIRKSILLR